MSNQIRTWCFAQPVGPGKKLLLLALAETTDNHGRTIQSVLDLTALTGIGSGSIRLFLAELVAAGLLESTTRLDTDGGRLANEYRILSHVSNPTKQVQ